jgi:hypothetical protein
MIQRPVEVRDGTNVINRTALPGTNTEDTSAWAVFRRVSYVQAAWDIARVQHLEQAVRDRLGEDVQALVDSLLPALYMSFKVVLATTVVGAVIGGVAGSIAAGAGAVPGGIAGAQLGFTVGTWILNSLGLAFLAEYVLSRCGAASELIGAGVREAWNSGGTTCELDAAARHLAMGVATLISLIVQALAAYAAKEGIMAASKAVQQSRFATVFQEMLQTKTVRESITISWYIEKLGWGTVAPEARTRLATAVGFLEKHFPRERVLDYLDGIDLHSPVEVVKLKRGDTLVQFSKGKVGDWFTRKGFSMDKLGVSSAGRGERYFYVNQPVDALKTRAAATVDKWTPGRRRDVYSPVRHGNGEPIAKAGEFAPGGGEQYVLPKALESVGEFVKVGAKPKAP